MSPMERTKKRLKDAGIIHWIVEHYNPWSKTRQDLFHIIDLLSLDNGVVGIQICGSDWMPHIRKITEEHAAYTVAWLQQPGTRLELHGWRKVKKKRGGKLMIWKPRIADVLLINNALFVEERDSE